MSDDVRSMLRAAGWSGFDANGCEIEYWVQNPEGDSVGIVRDRGGRMLLGMTWTADGECVGYGHDLVGLPSSVPAPVDVQDEQPEYQQNLSADFLLNVAAGLHGTSIVQERRMAMELIAARKTISSLKSDLESRNAMVKEHEENSYGISMSLDEARKRIAELEEERDRLRERIRTLERRSFGQTIIDGLQEFNDSLQCPPVQKLATSGPSITRPVPAVDAWIVWLDDDCAYEVNKVETIDGVTRIKCGGFSFVLKPHHRTGPSDRGPWRPIGEVR